MKPLLNTIYVTTEGASLRKDGENLVAELDGAEKARVPLHRLASVVVFGATYVSPPLIQALASSGITLVLLDRAGRFQARVEGPVSGNVLLRRAQYRVAEAPDEIVRGFVTGKVANQRAVVQRALRDHGEGFEDPRRRALTDAVDRLGRILARCARGNDGIDVLRGFEGEAGQVYFGIFDALILPSETEFRFGGRSRRSTASTRCCRSSTHC